MKPIFRITAAVTAAVLSTAAFGCENKKKTDKVSETETTTASQEETKPFCLEILLFKVQCILESICIHDLLFCFR